MALGILISGFENIGVVSFQKEMQFRRDFQFLFLRRFTGFAATLAFAFALQSYWALPLGALAGRIGGVTISYGMHPFRPRFTLSRFRQFWSFSQWMLFLNSGEYFAMRLDKFLVGHRADAAAVGAYSLADDVSVMPTSELLMPIGRVLFPAFVKVRDRRAELQYAYLLALAVQAMIAIPAAVGLAAIAHDAVALLLGEHWMGAVAFVQVLALIYGLNAFSHGASYLLLTLGRVRIMAIAVWVQILVFGLGAITFLADADPLGLARWRLAVSVIYTLAFVFLVQREVPTLRAREVLAVVWRPLLAAGAMAWALSLLSLEGWPLPASIATRIATGATVYALALLALWRLAGRPRGAESYLLDKLAFLLRRPVAAVKTTD
ncbi:MAG TPA: oligosaccharide flippase family protein, partial [Rhodocyclaceae bacterium]|nr:oligosaccharide flippase family protein [Rhodocyclaceae bacterium]